MGVKEGADPRDLSQAGWGVIFPEFGGEDASRSRQTEALQEALTPLLALREQQAGGRYRHFGRGQGLRPGESKDAFLARHGVGPGPADPDRMPYYLLIVGDPDSVPYRFQTQLDVQYAVGRIHFDTLEEYAQYARSVVTAETGQVALPRAAAFFGVQNPDDRVTQLSASQVVAPLASALRGRAGWQVSSLIGEGQATKAGLARLLGGQETPALLFAAGHGIGFRNGDPRQPSHQGALLCQDWPGPSAWRGAIPADFYFSSDDVRGDASLLGSIALLYASYSAGQGTDDAFAQAQQRRAKARSGSASPGVVARLPQRLLSHPRGGMLAVVGWTEQLWGASAQWPQAAQQLAAFEAVLHRLMDGSPVGFALEHLNAIYAESSVQLRDWLETIKFGEGIEKFGEGVDPWELAGSWAYANDARAHVLIGDPAVRLPLARNGDADLERPDPIEIGQQLPAQLTAAHSAFAQKVSKITLRVLTLEVATYLADKVAEDRPWSEVSISEGAILAAKTKIDLDGDSTVVTPIRPDGEVHEELWKVHNELVARATGFYVALTKQVIAIAVTLGQRDEDPARQSEPFAAEDSIQSSFSMEPAGPAISLDLALPSQVLDAWQSLNPGAGAYAGSTNTRRVEGLHWEADLPAEPKGALDALARARAVLDATAKALDAVEARLLAFASSAQPAGYSQTSFAAPSVPGAETDLAEMLGVASAPGFRSIAAPDEVRRRSASERYLEYMAALARCLDQPMAVQTRIAGDWQAQTTIAWAGSVDTVLQAPFDGARAEQHLHNVDLAILSVQALLRKLEVVGRGAESLARSDLLRGQPSQAALAYPAALRFVEAILDLS